MWLSISSDLLIASSYFSIPIAILMFVVKRQITTYRHIYILFAAFIFFCGLTHLFSIFTIFNGYYGYQALLKGATAIVSFATAVGVYYYLPLAFKLPKPSELLKQQKATTENELFKQMSMNSPIGFILVNQEFCIEHMNPKACQLFGYDSDKVKDLSINTLVPTGVKQMHTTVMQKYVDAPSDAYQMNAGRIVEGVTRDGIKIALEINLSTGIYHDEQFVFVSVIDREEKIEADNLLRSSLMKLDRITEATEDGLWEWNIVTNEVWQSKRHLQLMGCDVDAEPSFQLWEDHVHEVDRAKVLDEVNKCLINKTDYLVEYLGMTATGVYEWFRSKGKLTLDTSGDPYLLSGTIVNIHNDIIQKSDLINKTNYLEKVINRSINGLYIYNFESQNNLYINDEYSKITGYTLSDLIEMKEKGEFLNLFHPDEIDDVFKHIEEVQNSKEGEVHTLQYRFKSMAGHWVWLLSRDSVFDFNEDGSPKDMLGTFIDITQIRESEEIQRKLTMDFQNTFEMAAVGVAHVDLNGNWINVNKKCCEILGYDKKLLLSMSFQDVTFSEDLDLDLVHVNRLIEGTQDSYDMEKRYIRSDGNLIWANLTVSIVRNEGGKPDYFISVIEDISHRKSIELNQVMLNQELKNTNDQLTRFAYSASHDMQEPLRKITSFSTSLLERLGDSQLDEKSKFELERISSASRRMKNMIQRLLDLSRSAHVKLNLVEVPAVDLISDASDQLSVVIQESGTKINVVGEGDLYCDRIVISNVVENIIRNSIKYKDESRDPVINIEIKHSPGFTELVFSDNGIGFDNEYSQEIFEPFKRLVKNSDVDGTGMGLAICAQLISLHGGTIIAIGQQGVGSTFIVKLKSKGENHG